MFKEKIRFPAVADQFYPGEEKELSNIIENFLKEAKIPKIKNEIIGIIVPHAGYLFSGFVAAHAFKAILGQKIKTVLLIGDSHYERFDGISIWEKGKWVTPLGTVDIDEKLAKEILKESKRVFIRDSSHLFEHSLEVQVPFLQKVLSDFKILPLIFGSEDKDWEELAKIILKLKEKILILASSDLSHYPSYEIAKKVDLETINSILSCDPEVFVGKIKELEKKYPEVETFACAQDSIKTILKVAKEKKAKALCLKYQNSGDSVFGDKEQVVGYAAISFLI